MKKMKMLSVKSFFHSSAHPEKKDKSKAQKNGALFEKSVHSLQSLLFDIIDHKDLEKRDELPCRYLETHAPYRNMARKYADVIGVRVSNDRASQTEFVVHANDAQSTLEFPIENGEGLDVRVECKFQEVPGSVLDKLIKAVMDLQYGAPEKNVIIVYGGKEYDRPMAKAWVSYVKTICKSSENAGLTFAGNRLKAIPKKMAMMNVEEFVDWCNRAFYTK